MKKILIVSLFLLFFGLAPHVFADGFTALAPITGLTDSGSTSVVNSTTLANFFNNLYKYLIGVAAILAVIEITWSGIEIAVNKDNVSKLLDSKGRIYNAIFGLVLVLSPALIFSIINPSILNLSLNLPPLNTQSGIPTGSGSVTTGGAGTPASSAVDATTGCSVTGVANVLQKAVCPSDSAASQWASSSCSGRISSVTCLSQNSSGCTQKVEYCEYGSASIVFVDTGASNSFTYILQPINASMATLFQTFAGSCASAQGVLCTPGIKTYPSSNCANFGGYTTNISGGAAGKCYNFSVSCLTQADADVATSYFKNYLSGANTFSCVPDVQFTPQSIQ